jgi:sRNA-binding protein
LAQPNYQYAKRQKDLAKKKKQEEKRQRKLEKATSPTAEGEEQQPAAEEQTEPWREACSPPPVPILLEGRISDPPRAGGRWCPTGKHTITDYPAPDTESQGGFVC